MIAHFCAKFNKKYLDKLRKCDYTVSNLKRYGGDNVIKAGVFGSDEIQIMIDNLKIEDAMAIFFAQE